MSDQQFPDIPETGYDESIQEARRSILGRKFTPFVKDIDNLPTRGPVLVVATHIHASDAIVMKSAVGRDAVVLGSNKVSQTIRKIAGRRDPMQSLLLDAAEGFYDGKVVVMFPETLPSPDGALHRGSSLVAKAILENAVPVIPAVISPIVTIPELYGRKLVEFGPRIRMSRWYKFRGQPHLLERAIADQVMYTLMMMSGRPYSDVDASVTWMQRELVAKRAQRDRSRERLAKPDSEAQTHDAQ